MNEKLTCSEVVDRINAVVKDQLGLELTLLEPDDHVDGQYGYMGVQWSKVEE
jgi:hypothetical protein